MTQILIESAQNILKPELTHQIEHSPSFDVMYLLRILFYILVVVKLIELSFLRRKKHNLKERVYRKFIFAHQEILKQFNDQDRYNMEQTLNNTIKNASVSNPSTKNKHKKSKKRVSFIVEKNTYHEPKQWKEEQQDEEEFLDINQKESIIRLEEHASFEEKKVEDQFQERSDLDVINQQIQGPIESSSKITAETQPSQQPRNQGQAVSELPVDSKLNSKIQENAQESKTGKNEDVRGEIHHKSE